jgi:N-carbamoylputrescine amidase
LRKVKVAATQMSCSNQIDENIAKADLLVREAAAKGAQIILIQELFETLYFCQKEKPEYYNYATEVEENKAIEHFRKVAKELWKLGYATICPHSNSGLFNSTAEENFLNGDIEILKKCDVLVLIQGWESSAGTLSEIEIAIQNNIRIYEWEDNKLIELKMNYIEV